MITLVQFPAIKAWRLACASPFCTKVAAFLKVAGIEFEYKYTMDPRSAPRKRFPYIIDDNEVIPDSTLILEHLKNKYKVDLDSFLTDEQRAYSLSWQVLIESQLVLCLVYFRWVDQQGWDAVKPVFFAKVPFPFSLFVPEKIRKKAIRSINGSTLGGYTRDEIDFIAKRDIDALASKLGEQQYFFGEQISTLDIVAYAVLVNIARTPFTNGMRQHLLATANLMNFIDRFEKDTNILD